MTRKVYICLPIDVQGHNCSYALKAYTIGMFTINCHGNIMKVVPSKV